ncbi:MAG: hypothetical protein V9E89_06220 [Ilumatobacteraceae bacterium]
MDAAADRPAGGPPPGGAGQGSAALVAQAAALWPEIRPTLKALAKALFAKSEVAGERDGALALTAPNEAHLAKCREVQADVEKAIAGRVGATVRVVMVIGDGHDDGDDVLGNVVPIRPSAVMADDEIDPDDIVDAPPDDVVTPLDRLKQAFPGSTVVDE